MHRIEKLMTVFSIAALAAISSFAAQPTNTFTVAAYNIENWVLMDRNGKPDQPKPTSDKEAVFGIVAKVHPDVLSVEEMGTTNELAELITGLRAHGVDFPYHEWIQGADTNRHVSLLSRFPIVERFSRTDYNYLLNGKPQRIERGILDVKLKVNDQYSFRAVVAHLKSKRKVDVGDQAMMRLEEAKLLRSHIGKALKNEPELNLIVMGDFNDTPEAEPIRAIIGPAPFALFELLPVDSKGGHDTYYWKYRNQFSRIDYLITSPGMQKDYVPDSARIADFEGWNDASDHRAIYAKFYAQDRKGLATPLKTESSQSVGGFIVFWLVLVSVATGSVAITVAYRQGQAPKL
jgi:endonuclease/exonuclease/phosphatase family metal-dependent hydrolase